MNHEGNCSKRELLRLAGLAVAGAALQACQSSASFISPVPGEARLDVAEMSGQRALEILLEGNHRFVDGRPLHPRQSEKWRQELAKGQHPFAMIHTCADSRLPVDAIFDQGLGDLFVTRVVGNVLTDAVLSSLEFGAGQLHVPLIVVLGHQGCDAVAAAVQAVEGGDRVSNYLSGVVRAITPAVKRAGGRYGDPIDNAARANVELVVAHLRSSRTILAPLVAEDRLRIVGAYYNLSSGLVDMIVP